MNTRASKPIETVDKIMEQAQVFASSWALVGSRFDQGNERDNAQEQKATLRAMVIAATAVAGGPQAAKPEPTGSNLSDDMLKVGAKWHGIRGYWTIEPYQLKNLLSLRALSAGIAAAPTADWVNRHTRDPSGWVNELLTLAQHHEPIPTFARNAMRTIAHGIALQAGKPQDRADGSQDGATTPLTDSQIIAMRFAVPGGNWATETEAIFFERGVKAAEKHHGISKATGGTAP